MNHYNHDELRECISFLLEKLDQYLPPEMHYRGMTPDWFVAAAMMASNVPDTGSISAIECIRKEEQ